MGGRKDLAGLPEMPDGLTLGEVAARAQQRLGRNVSSQEVYAVVVRKGHAPTGRARREIVRPRVEECLVIPADSLDQVIAALDSR